MALNVNTNVASLNAQRNLSTSSAAMQESIQRLSSGKRINSAKDDAAGLAIVEGMNAQIRGNTQAARNATDGISLAQTAEGTISQMTSNVQRIREIATQASNASVSDNNRLQLQKEVDQLTSENKRLVDTTEFNGTKLFSGTATTTGLTFQVGAGSTAANDQITFTMPDLTAGFNASGAATKTVDVTSNTSAFAALTNLDNDLKTLTDNRATLGAVQNRFSAVVDNLNNYIENMSASKSRIEDTDFASETAKMTRNSIIQQAGTAVLAQANQLPQGALSLLR